MIKNSVFTIAVSVMALSFSAVGQENVRMANIISVTPVTEHAEVIKQQCGGSAGYQAPQQHSIIGTVLGGVAGALVGRNVGNGTGRTVATVAGAAGGAYLGDKIAGAMNEAQPTCRNVSTYEPRFGGFMIVYELDGEQYSVRSQTFPQGKTIPIKMAPVPVEQ